MKAGPATLEPFYGPTRGFSFLKEIQPILNKHCAECHGGEESEGGRLCLAPQFPLIEPLSSRLSVRHLQRARGF